MTTPTFSEVQARADAAALALGHASAVRALDGESLTQYRRRLLTRFQHLSDKWKRIDLSTAPADVLTIAEDGIYADAAQEAAHPNVLVRPGELREVKTADAAGRFISRFYGNPEITWGPFKSVGKRIVGFGGR